VASAAVAADSTAGTTTTTAVVTEYNFFLKEKVHAFTAAPVIPLSVYTKILQTIPEARCFPFIINSIFQFRPHF
jgi:hypothetical protein